MKIKEFIKQYRNVIFIIAFILIASRLGLSFKWMILGLFAFGFYNHRKWLKLYWKSWLEQYRMILEGKNGRKKDD